MTQNATGLLTIAATVGVELTATNRDILRFDNDVVRATNRLIDVLDNHFAGSLIYDCLHFLSH